jgi:hypothetical protein
MKRVLLSWSSGKDSAWSLHVLRQHPDIELVGLLTTLNTEFQRVAMHGTRRSVLEAQAAAAELPLWIVPLPWPCSNEIYEQRMTDACNRPSTKTSMQSPSAICFWKTSAPIARNSSSPPASNRCFLYGRFQPANWLAK